MLKEALVFTAILGLAHSSALKITSRDGNRNRYFAYTPNDKVLGQEIFIYDTPEVLRSILSPELDINIIVHGHDSETTSVHPDLKDTILTYKEANVIVVDWSSYSNRGYASASMVVPSIGYGLADLLRVLVDSDVGFTLDNIHLIGFDLGAHVCGYAGRDIGSGRNVIGKITGLSPSGLNWGAGSGRLTKGDARTVEVIHTDTLQNGIGEVIGDIDIFVSTGRSQLGCSTNWCSHNRANEIMMASISHELYAKKCELLTDVTRNTCYGRLVKVGSTDLSKLASGIYRITATREYPYA